MKNRKRMNFLGHAARTRVEKKKKKKKEQKKNEFPRTCCQNERDRGVEKKKKKRK